MTQVQILKKRKKKTHQSFSEAFKIGAATRKGRQNHFFFLFFLFFFLLSSRSCC